MTKGSIALHPKYGLNPTIPICIICGKDKNEVALLGNAYKGEAPRHMVTSIEPCDECKSKYLVTGVMLIEADENEHGKPEITGSIMVVTEDAFKRMFNHPVPQKRMAYLTSDSFQSLYKEYKKETN